jgi:arginase
MNATQSSLDQGHTPIVLGGDHSIAIGTVSGVAAHFRSKGQKLGLIWVDAHADVNTPQSSPSGNIHGMPLAVILGSGHDALVKLGGERIRIAPKNIALIGIRMIDMIEKEILRSSGISYFTMRDIDEKGMTWVMEQAIAAASDGTDAIHVSFDLDAIDPVYAPGVSTPVTGGLSFREAHLALEKAYESGRLASIEFAELNPSNDIRSQTATLCVDLIQSALGKSIV